MKGRLLSVIIGALALVGCYEGSARTVSIGHVNHQPGWALVSGMRLVRQSSEHGCGAAALAMVLQRWGVPSSSDAAIASESAADDLGIAAGALRDLARRKGLQAFLIRGEEADLSREVSLDRPVLVGLVQRYTTRSYSHYEVVVGMNRSLRRVLMLDPGRGMREDDFDSFAAEWGGAGRLTLVVGPH